MIDKQLQPYQIPQLKLLIISEPHADIKTPGIMLVSVFIDHMANEFKCSFKKPSCCDVLQCCCLCQRIETAGRNQHTLRCVQTGTWYTIQDCWHTEIPLMPMVSSLIIYDVKHHVYIEIMNVCDSHM